MDDDHIMYGYDILLFGTNDIIIASLATEVLKNCGMKYVSLLSYNRLDDKFFFAPFCESLADQVVDGKLSLSP